ncbi:MAG: TetR/AcrR family transcriptional regulator [Polyangiaceae bacterium]|nr:TetR/AcrR family transcriptional regulator [Polyangiaceae bacterium]
MPYPPDHKPKTHARIVRVAARLFRKDGFQATGVDRLMSAAGLTRGGFYAHFRDKTQLLIESLERVLDESQENLLGRGLDALEGDAWARAAAKRYLSSAHRAGPADGCPVPALGAEVARAPASVQKVFAARIDGILRQMAARLGGGTAGRRRAIQLLSSWVGALLLARAVGERRLGEEILAAVRAQANPPRRRRTH